MSEKRAEGRDLIDIYIDLDSLLDFRLSTVSRLNDEFASSLFTEEYIDRQYDAAFFEKKGGIPEATFLAEYAKRDAEYLKGAFPTAIYWHLGRVMAEHMLYNDQPGGHRYVRVSINTWPFVLSDEATSVLENAVSIYLDAKAEIRTIHESPVSLNPASVRTRFTDFFIYDFNLWIQSHVDELVSTGMQPVQIWTPAISRGKPLTKEVMADLRNEFKDNVNPFEWTRQWLMDAVQLNYMDTRHFSVELKQYPVGAA